MIFVFTCLLSLKDKRSKRKEKMALGMKVNRPKSAKESRPESVHESRPESMDESRVWMRAGPPM
jgi:hypothetical protein